MHNLRCQTASPDLQPFVRAFAQREVVGLQEPVREPVPARLEQTLEFQFGEPFEVCNGARRERVRNVNVIGSYTDGGWAVTLTNKIVSFGIFFHPVGFSRLFDIPAVEVTNRALDAAQVLPPGILDLHDQLRALPSFSARVAAAEQYLRLAAVQSSPREDNLAYHAAGRIFRAKGAVSIREVASEYGLSVRQFERRIANAVGLAPKPYARVARFQFALDSKLARPQTSWMAIAHDLGYHDQMHMVRDFHELAGAAPSVILATIRDARPPAMQDFSEF